MRQWTATFRLANERIPIAWFGVPGPTGFEVGQHVARVHLATMDDTVQVTRWTWVVFTLRAGPSCVEVARRMVSEVLSRGWCIEMHGNELVLYRSWPTRVTSPRLWLLVKRVHSVLEPMLARPERTSDTAERGRRRVQLAIEAPRTAPLVVR